MDSDVSFLFLAAIATFVTFVGLVISGIFYVQGKSFNESLEKCISGGGKPIECISILRKARLD